MFKKQNGENFQFMSLVHYKALIKRERKSSQVNLC